MEDLWRWLISLGPWSWLSSLSLPGIALAWIARRRDWHPIDWLDQLLRPQVVIWRLRRDLRSCEDSNVYLRSAVEQLSDAGLKVIQTQEARATTSAPSTSGRSPSPRSSIASHPKRKRGPLDLP